MNTIFGIWRPGGCVSEADLRGLAAHTAHFAFDGERLHAGSELGMGMQACHTHIRSRLEKQPGLGQTGNLIVYDGRLDNYHELLEMLDADDSDIADPDIILLAYQRLGSDCFAHLIGDWALALWDSKEQALYLARDHAGTRTLHYARNASGTVTWSTYLDSFLDTRLLDAPDETYVAGYLAMLPNYGRTPYRDVRAVLPGHFLRITPNGLTAKQFWSPMVYERLSYGSEGDYDACFLQLLEQAVARRTGPGYPMVAQMSGGMDSTAIVCVSDKLRRSEGPNPELIDTLSFFNESDSNWNERPYFTLVEKHRGKAGIHMDSSRYGSTLDKPHGDGANYLYPGTNASSIQWDRDLCELTKSHGYRIIISGIGGDELTGGVPDVRPEVADHIVAGRAIAASHLAVAWCLSARISLTAAAWGTVRFFADHCSSIPRDPGLHSTPWFTDKTLQLCDHAGSELPLVAFQPFNMYPSAVANCRSWWFTLRTQPHLRPSEVYRFEYRYPYFDRDLVDFFLRVPPGELVKPGRRRALMRRALIGIVPHDILERRRKAFLLKTQLGQITLLAPRFEKLINNSVLQELGFIKGGPLKKALDDTVHGMDLRWWPLILRAITVETWLRRHFQRSTAATAQRVPAANALRSVPAEKVPL
jgi:asparagine synthase (glutamine-hydrolysing)